jgi:acyl-CoA thioester hydrolase
MSRTAKSADSLRPISSGPPLEVAVYYEDTDAGGVVYYANYLKYFERARTLFFQFKQVPLDRFHRDGVVFTVAEAEVQYKSPARYGDVLLVQTDLVELQSASFRFRHIIKNKRTGTLVCAGSTRMVCVNAEGKPTRLPPEVKERFGTA